MMLKSVRKTMKMRLWKRRMSDETMHIRIRWRDYKIIRRLFPAIRGETAANYFYRLRKYLEMLK